MTKAIVNVFAAPLASYQSLRAVGLGAKTSLIVTAIGAAGDWLIPCVPVGSWSIIVFTKVFK